MKHDRTDTVLVADVGGTNVRFALSDRDGTQREQRVLACADFASLQQACEHYLAVTAARPTHAAIAVACPVTGDAIRLTNRAWSFSRRELEARLGVEELVVLNDFGAIAWAIPALGPQHRVTLHGDAGAPLRGPISVVGPGTGLGVALLVGDPARGWHVIETEGGHVTFAPIGGEEQLIARWLDARHGRTSTERLLSGRGLSEIHAVLAAGDASPTLESLAGPLRDPADIVAAALEGHDLVARRTLARFCAILGSVAGDVALMHGARTVMIAGGIVPRFAAFLESSAFRERFLAKGRFAALLESVAVQVVMHAQPGLLGAAVAARAHRMEPAA